MAQYWKFSSNYCKQYRQQLLWCSLYHNFQSTHVQSIFWSLCWKDILMIMPIISYVSIFCLSCSQELVLASFYHFYHLYCYLFGCFGWSFDLGFHSFWVMFEFNMKIFKAGLAMVLGLDGFQEEEFLSCISKWYFYVGYLFLFKILTFQAFHHDLLYLFILALDT